MHEPINTMDDSNNPLHEGAMREGVITDDLGGEYEG